MASSAWQAFDGWCASRNVEPYELGIDRFVNLVYYWAVRQMDSEDKRAEFDRWVYSVAGGSVSESMRQASGDWSRDAELAQFVRG